MPDPMLDVFPGFTFSPPLQAINCGMGASFLHFARILWLDLLCMALVLFERMVSGNLNQPRSTHR